MDGSGSAAAGMSGLPGGDCAECDTTGKRWYLSEREELLLRKKGIIQAIERLMRQLDEIDAALLRLESPKHLHFPPPVVK